MDIKVKVQGVFQKLSKYKEIGYKELNRGHIEKIGPFQEFYTYPVVRRSRECTEYVLTLAREHFTQMGLYSL